MKSIVKIASWVTILVALAGCAVLTEKPEPPKVSIAGLNLVSAGFFEQRYLLKLRMQNPNDANLVIKALDYDVFVNDLPFAHGVTKDTVSSHIFLVADENRFSMEGPWVFVLLDNLCQGGFI